MREGQWKAIQQPFDSPVRLYDLSADIGEETDLATRHPEVVQRLSLKMAAEYEPAVHMVHNSDPFWDLYLPLLHAVHVT